MPKYIVQAVRREGHDGVWRAGRKWASDAPTEIEVLDQDDDGAVIETKDAAGRVVSTIKNPTVVGRRSFEAMKADGRISIRPAEGGHAEAAANPDVQRLRDQVQALEAELTRARAERDRLAAREKAESREPEAPTRVATAADLHEKDEAKRRHR